MNSNKSPILTLNQYSQGLNPMPFSHYRKTGILAQETKDMNGQKSIPSNIFINEMRSTRSTTDHNGIIQ